MFWKKYIDGLAQDCINSSALAMGSLQFCSKPSICFPAISQLQSNAVNKTTP